LAIPLQRGLIDTEVFVTLWGLLSSRKMWLLHWP
jgi:hypothetical protein